MSVHFLSQMKECNNKEEFMKLLVPTLQNGRVTVKRELSQQEKRKLQQPQDYVSQIHLYREGEESSPFEEKHKIVLQFQRTYRERNYKYELRLGGYISALENQDMKDTERADFIVTKKPLGGTTVETLKIPVEVISKLNPEIIERNGKRIALIKLNEDQIKQVLSYSKAGVFLWRLSGYLRFHAGEKTETDRRILESYFKGRNDSKKAYAPNIFENFIQRNESQLKEIITTREKAKEKISDVVSKKYGIQIKKYKAESFVKLEQLLKGIPKSEKESMIKEIEAMTIKN
jgi:hypothetical protein